MNDLKTPQAGEWWLSGSSPIAYVVGFTIDGDPAWQQKGSRQILSDKIGFFLACFHHEPRCDSFDWTEPQVEVWPKYYASIIGYYGYYRCDSGTEVYFVGHGDPVLQTNALAKRMENTAVWREVTEAEALARVKPESAAKRIPVRLWVSYRIESDGGDWPIRCTPADEEFDNNGGSPWKEILHDADGFYIKESRGQNDTD